MRFNRALRISALVGALGLIALPAGSAHASSSSSFPLGGFSQVVADTAHGHLFVSPGAGNGNSIVVTNLAGQKVSLISGQDGASGMTLSPDGTTLYVALAGSDAVSAIDTSTLKQTALYPLTNGDSPASIAVAGGKLWVGYWTAYNGGYIGEIDPAATPSFTAEALPGNWYYAPQIAVDPLGGGTLVAADSGLSVDAVGSYDVATAPPTVYSQAVNVPSCGYENDVAVLPGGAQFVLACNEETGLLRYDTKTLAPQGTGYPSASAPNTVTVAPDGTVALGIGNTNPDVLVYRSGGTTPVNAYRFDGVYNTLVGRGLAWAANSSRLFAVIQNWSATPDTYTVHALNDPERTAARVALSGPPAVVRGKAYTLHGKLTLTVGKPPAGTRIAITQTKPGTTTMHWTEKTASNGSFSLTTKPPALGNYTYTARYAGDASRQAATATRVVTIVRLPVALTLRASAGTVSFRQRVTVTAHLGKTYTGRRVSIYAQSFGSKARKLLRAGRVNSGGYLSANYAPTFNTTFSVVFGGDAKYAPKTVSHAVRVRAQVSQSISGYYTSTYISGTLYRVYHHTASLRLNIKVTPNKSGECVEALVQIYDQGGWYPDLTTSCGHLSGSSTSYGDFPLSKAAGYQYRIRTDYIRSSKDNKNLGNHSSWLYFEVVN